MIIEGAEPFLLKGDSDGVLLIHGFTGLPTELLLFGEYLNRAGFTVICPRLAGHATTAEDLERTTRENWFNTVLDAYFMLRCICDRIFVVGHSMGALLALKLSVEYNVEKVVTVAAPMFVDKRLGAEQLPPRDKCAGLFVESESKILHDVPTAANMKYRKMPLISVHELFNLMDEVKESLSKVKSPLLIIHAKDDKTAQPRSAEFIFDAVSSETKKLFIVEGGGHLLPLTENRELVFNETVKWLIK